MKLGYEVGQTFLEKATIFEKATIKVLGRLL